MKPEVKEFWLELAEEYRNIPEDDYRLYEYSCGEIARWWENVTRDFIWEDAYLDLNEIWTALGYSRSSFPIGDNECVTEREAFCQDMADFIEESVDRM